MNLFEKLGDLLNPSLDIADVSTRKSCMPCRHCKVLQGKLNTPMSFLCFKGRFELTTNQKELENHSKCTMFDYEC